MVVAEPPFFGCETLAFWLRNRLFPDQQNALGSSAIVKILEQTGAAPKPIQGSHVPRKGSQVPILRNLNAATRAEPTQNNTRNPAQNADVHNARKPRGNCAKRRRVLLILLVVVGSR